MIAASVASREDIAKVMFDDEIFERTNGDLTPAVKPCDIFNADLSDYVFIGGYVNGEIASLFIVHKGVMHFWVLKEFRMLAYDLLDVSFRLWPDDVTVEIPSLYRSVINFALNYGFIEEDVKPKAFLKNGENYDVHILRYKHG